MSQSQLCTVAFPFKVFFKNWVAKIVGVLLKFSSQKDVYIKGIQNYSGFKGIVLFRNKSSYH